MYNLDHIVHFVEAPENLVEQLETIGVHTFPGGKHEMWGTYNSLSYFEDLSYIEFIGIFDENLFTKSAKEPFTLHETYERSNRENGFRRIALRTYSIEEDTKRLQEAGLTIDGPKVFSRNRPDGSVVKWKLLHFGLKEQELDFPFLIEWDSEDQVRYDELVENGAMGCHPLGKLKIDTIVFSVSNLEFVKQWETLFQISAETTDKFVKLVTPNCKLLFYLNFEGQNKIIEVIISGSRQEKVVTIENATYKFTY